VGPLPPHPTTDIVSGLANHLNNFDVLLKNLKSGIPVIPANPGSGPGQAPESGYFKPLKIIWTPVSTGVTTFY